MPSDDSSRIFRFGIFEVDLEAGDLRRNGLRVKLQEQPFQVLAALLERPGQIVTREELTRKLWRADTFVDFDHSLNAAIKRLRDTLGESAENPIFVETVARRGYRFIGNIRKVADNAAALSDLAGLEPDATISIPTKVMRLQTSASGPWTRRWQFGAVVLAIVLVAGVTGGRLLWRRTGGSTSSPGPITLRRLTTNASENGVISSAISPDGRYLAYSDKTGVYLRLLSTGESHRLLATISDVTFLGWFPDSLQLLASWSIPPAKKRLWTLSILGGSPRQLSDEGWSASVSPDSSQIVFLKGAGFAETGKEIWLMQANGANPHKLISFPEGRVLTPVWSPDGRWIAYLKSKDGPSGDEPWIEVFNLEHGTRRVVLAQPSLSVWGLSWLPDGRFLYALYEPPPSQNSSNFWVARINPDLGRFVGTPARITSGDGFVVQPSITADSKHLVFDRDRPHGNVYVSEFSADGPRLGTPRRLTIEDANDVPFDWTVDNKAVLFISDRTGAVNIFRQGINETSAEMLVFDGDKKFPICRLSPDGAQILYSVSANPDDSSQPVRLMRAPIEGGPPHMVLEALGIGNYGCSHAPATLCAFSQEISKEVVISVFDPAIGTPYEVAKLPAGWSWGLSPDGTSIAAFAFGAADNRIRLLSLSGQSTRELLVKNWSTFTSLDWAADSNGLFVTSNPTGLKQSLLYVDLAGKALPIWEVNNIWASWAIPSRNGKYVAIPVATLDSNVWMADNF